jgi:hypothetical protein
MRSITLPLPIAVVVTMACAGQRYDLRGTEPPAVAGPGSHAVGIVRVESPWYAFRFLIRGKFREAVPEYEAKTALETKAFTISDDGEFGGIYLWSTRRDAERFYSDDWRRSIRERRGVEPKLLVMDAPFVVQGRAVVHGDPLGARSIAYAASATLVLGSPAVPGGEIEAARALAERLKDADGLVRGATLVGSGKIGFVALWATRELAERALARRQPFIQNGDGRLEDATAVLFDAPVLIDASLRISDGRG